MLKKGDVVEVAIESLNFGGEGIARYSIDEGKLVVFVEGTVPGDVARVRIGAKKRGYARGYVVDFVKQSQSRVAPKCKHFGECGGCSLQYLSYEDQLKMKEQQVRDAVERIGKLDSSVVQPIVGCDEPWFYRNKMEFSFSRSLSGASRTEEGDLSLGLHVRRRHHDVVELTECYLFAPYIGAFVQAVRAFFGSQDLSDGPALQSLVVREGKNTGEILVNLITENGEANFLEDFSALVREFFNSRPELQPGLTSLYSTLITNVKGQRKKFDEQLLWGKPTIREALTVAEGNVLHFDISPGAFFQPNTRQAEKLFGLAVHAAGLSGKEVVYDLYCGAGTIALSCARSAKHVYGIEVNAAALANAKANAELNNISNVTFLEGDVAKKLPALTEKPDVVMVDPPRSGLHEDVVRYMGALGPGRIVYVSCNPSTLARDLSLFTKTGYALEKVQPVDMFPQTYHIENVASLRKN